MGYTDLANAGPIKSYIPQGVCKLDSLQTISRNYVVWDYFWIVKRENGSEFLQRKKRFNLIASQANRREQSCS